MHRTGFVKVLNERASVSVELECTTLPVCRCVHQPETPQTRYYWGFNGGLSLIVNKRIWNAVLGCNLKTYRMSSVHFLCKAFNISVIQVFAPTTNAKEAEVKWFYEDLQDLERTPKKDVLFIIGNLNAKVGSQENTWSNRQVWPWITKWNRTKANRAWPGEDTGHSKHLVPTTHKMTLHMDITRWSIPKLD